ncbi:MAG: DUF167 domain-containing protein [Deferribacteres bacterium]|nr:DUF167 domain-containing protein [Deferribacteres bacterium]
MIREKQGRVFIDVRVQPRASRKRYECADGVVKLWVTAPPVDQKANEAVVEFVAEILSVRKSAVRIEKGLKSKNKVVSVEGLPLEKVVERLKC